MNGEPIAKVTYTSNVAANTVSVYKIDKASSSFLLDSSDQLLFSTFSGVDHHLDMKSVPVGVNDRLA